VKVYQFGVSVAPGEIVNVELDVAVPGAGVKVVLLHEALIEFERPEIDRAMGPWKEPAVSKVNRSLALVPCATGM
jgi:hypothetical protein